MAKSKSGPSALNHMTRQMTDMMTQNAMLAPQVEHFWEAQENILNETERFARHWFERRHAATRTALEAAHDVARNGSSDPTMMIKAITDWQAHSMERIAADIEDCAELFSRCAGHVTRAETEAGEEGLEEAARNVNAAGAAQRHASVPV
ncbi:hypothetical protein [Roseovarius sp. SYSU LYC5161]|jgi:hypothetical protein|uniref:hypothetical protein n=1 Tax=Roseovarius halophilus (ex Wu et al. 2025) TaxID=3376060 RepID=UPI002871688E|nr:hypothetical protein [Roseovarius sp.]